MAIFPGRYTAQSDEPFIVFLIGMRINRVLAFWKWLPVMRGMQRMLAELKQKPELGLLHVEWILYWRGIGLVQYWRSFEYMHAYAHAKDRAHLPAWADFNRSVGNSGSVGIWHETYTISPGQHESVYLNMPKFGLARATKHAAITDSYAKALSHAAKQASIAADTVPH